jgi:seryl-tRNA synthetase
MLRRLFLRIDAIILRDIAATRRELDRVVAMEAQFPDMLRQAKEKLEQLAARKAEVSQAIDAMNRSDFLKRKGELSAEPQPLTDERAAINKALADIEASVMR